VWCIIFVEVKLLLSIPKKGLYHIIQLGSSFVWTEFMAEVADSFLKPEAFEVGVLCEAQLSS
jgi:hypothetical protein